MSAEPGVRFGPYEIRSALGAGGMGEVYVAHDTRLDRDVALKLLPKALATDPDRLRRFETEARAASALNHPAIPAIYDFGDAAGQPYISMELVHGRTLRHVLDAGAVPPRRALQIAAQIADGLAKAHDAGIVHRDLKPENLMVTDDGFAKILDFGLAKLATAADAHRETMTVDGTQPGSVMGTAGYMSPEQAAGHPADSRSDQFSFGLVLYEMLTGRRAFDRPTAPERMSAIIRDEAIPIEQINRAVPAPVRWIVERCLVKQPAERYASTRDLARDMASARDHLSELVAASSTAPAPPRQTRSRRELVAWMLAALLAIVSGILATRSFSRPSVNEPGPLRFTVTAPDDHTFAGGIMSTPFALSPDGRRLAFAADSSSNRRQIWVRAFDALVPRAIAGTDGGMNPFWSADGQWIAFFAGGRLKRVPAAGGDVVTICDARAGGGGTWSRDGTILFGDGLDSPLKEVSATGGAPIVVTELDAAQGDSAHLHPVFHPDGRHFVFTVLNGARGGTYLGSLGSRDIRKLADDTVTAEFIAPDQLVIVTRDGHLIAQRVDVDQAAVAGPPVAIAENVDVNGPNSSFSAAASGALVYWTGSEDVTQPTWVARNGQLGDALGSPSTYVNVAIAPDGAHVAVDRFTPTPAIWMLDVARGTAARETAGDAIYQSTPVWSPDGRALVYAQAVDTPPNLYLKPVGSLTQAQRLFRTIYQSFPQTWSPDGESLVYVTIEPKTNTDIWRVPIRGDAKPTALIRTPYIEQYPRISPDGRWLVYVSNESGRFEVYVARFPTADGRRQISTDGGSFPLWRRDGRELYYVARDGTVMAATMQATADGEISAGRPTPLFKAPAFVVGPGSGSFYDVAPDGRFLFNVFVKRTSPPATVVLNWRPGEPSAP